jgi:predicted ribosomally synthesized peptide with SipW-like signal peptide
MKKIVLSIFAIGIVSVGAFYATKAFFNDTETSTGNTFSAGTIDIAVDGQNPWAQKEPFVLEDMKPSQHAYTEYVIQNVGTNPANVFKKVDITDQNDGVMSEPECVEGGGTWTAPVTEQTTGTCNDTYVPNFNIASVIRYDMRVWVYNEDPKANPNATPIWWDVIYTDDMAKMLSDVNGQNVLLGMIPAGWWMKVDQSYHMDPLTTNWAQGDKLQFNITLTAEQLKNTVTMMEKIFPAGQDPTFVYGGNLATVTYDVKEDKFNYDLTVSKAVDGAYTLIAWDDKANLYAFNWGSIGNAIALANVTVTGNTGSATGSIDLNKDFINAKLWLIDGTYTPGTTIGPIAWNPTNWMFETALADYYDSLK